MAVYYFHLRDEFDVPDEEGRDFPDAAAARAAAIVDVRELLCDEVRKGKLDLRHRIDVADEHGERVATIGFAEAIELIS